MTRRPFWRLVAVSLVTVFSNAVLADDANLNWPSFRGRSADGFAPASLPAKWDVATGENIKWKTNIDGLGHGGPVVWGNQVFVVTATGESAQPVKTGVFGDITPVEGEKSFEWKVLCLDLASGKTIWNKSAAQGAAKVIG